ncbi:MAG: response regulator transcription factor [Clostridia bacterium]|nr:response regulator transcription factor [Clostridia bacterium]
MRILIVDDHPLFACGLADLMAGRGVEATGTAKDGLEALAMAREMRPDVILMDISMPRCDGLAATRLIKAELPEMSIVILTAIDSDSSVFEAVKSGASGYVLKDVDADELMEMLSALEKSEVAFSPGLTARILEEFTRLGTLLEARDSQRSRDPAPHGDRAGAERRADDDRRIETESILMPRQMQVLRLVASGMSYKEVGSALFISERTVKHHMRQILDQLHLQNRAQVLVCAARMRLGDSTDPFLS